MGCSHGQLMDPGETMRAWSSVMLVPCELRSESCCSFQVQGHQSLDKINIETWTHLKFKFKLADCSELRIQMSWETEKGANILKTSTITYL